MSKQNTEGESQTANIAHPEVRHEKRDVNARLVYGFLIALAIAGVFIELVLWGMFNYFRAGYQPEEPQPNAMMSSTRNLPPQANPSAAFPEPKLQPDPVADLNKFRGQEEQLLNSYGWVDQRAGVVRIPIERAMQIMAEKGMPSRPAQNPTGAQGARQKSARQNKPTNRQQP